MGLAEPLPVEAVAEQLGLGPDDIELHGRHRAKVTTVMADGPCTPGAGLGPGPEGDDGCGRLVLVTATTPGRRSAGKTVTALGLGMGLARLGRRGVVTLRQSALGPTLGSKGGGAGGGAARIEPFVDSLLGLGADTFAVESAHNLLAAALEDALHRGRDVDPGSVAWRRVVDMDDRSLRAVRVGMGATDGPPRDSGFDITAASEVMAILALCRNLADMRTRLAAVVPARRTDGTPLTAGDLEVAGAMAVVLREAYAPNLLQSSEGTPVLVHTGPFGNIAPGCSSVVADRLALGRAEYVVTEAGFGADLGAENFVHLKSPLLGRGPDAAVLVATVGCLREHGGGDADRPDPDAVRAGCSNLRRHVATMLGFGIPTVVSVNRHPDDDEAEIAVVAAEAGEAGAATAVHDAFADGGAGCEALAAAVVDAAARPSTLRPLVARDAPVADKVETIATRIYGAGAVEWSAPAAETLARLVADGFGHLPVCMAKTHLSLSHDRTLLGAPSGFTLPVAEIRLAAGAGYVTVLAGDISTMPGLPSSARFRGMDLAPDGSVSGLA